MFGVRPGIIFRATRFPKATHRRILWVLEQGRIARVRVLDYSWSFSSLFARLVPLSFRRVLLSKPKDPIAFLATQVKKVSQVPTSAENETQRPLAKGGRQADLLP